MASALRTLAIFLGLTAPAALAAEQSLRPRNYDVEGRHMHAVAAGDPSKPTVLFIHGSPGDWSAYRAYLENPALQAQAQLLSVDRPGFGHSGPGEAETSLAAQVRMILPLLEGRGPAVLVGHSLGGPVAARLAMDHPDKVAGILILAGSIDPAQEKLRWYNRVGAWGFVRKRLSDDWRASNDEILPLRGELEQMLPLWPRVTMPVIVIHGTRDRLVPVENASFAAKVIPHAEVILLKGEDHFLPWKQEALVLEKIRALLPADGS